MEAQTNDADTQNQKAAQLYRDAEQATQARDLALGSGNPVEGTLLNYVRSVRDVLSGIYKGKEQKLGDWTFEVNQAAAGGNGTQPQPQQPAAK
jgi:hypothetical protein